MKIIKKTNRKVGKIPDYSGVCDNCGTPIECDEDLIVIEVADLEDVFILVPVDTLVCPECDREIRTVKVYKSMEVSGEIAKLKQESKE